jgi:hypothetical protein
MEYIKVTNQEVLDNLKNSVRWGHAFIKEIYALSKSFKERDGFYTSNPDALMDWIILVVTDDQDNPGIEFKFYDVEDIKISFNTDMRIKGIIEQKLTGSTSIVFSFGSDLWFRAKRLDHRVLNQEVWGDHSIYGHEFK